MDILGSLKKPKLRTSIDKEITKIEKIKQQKKKSHVIEYVSNIIPEKVDILRKKLAKINGN